ncbi:hypothetical protein SAY87_017435 [Trapa incisa]|uniref:AAA+ ATPase domain-containing protein n=2 Tax=Trapa TaxID=22665 RepID=A0AAN7L3Z5_9MYRT|nr:hypothetical protein SAY87_029265 [Trapa incisa]KAK4781329.1 hypothetical protein SAY87_017435 [Trapa incisa]KAK4789636.1 hypothetical protein SAY86_016940 [Trapa natans]KAK4791514.1 hypothetical protein SAY86_031927 [Trapa natans]
MRELWTSLASVLGVLAFCQSLLQVIFPPELRFAFIKFLNRAFHCFSAYCYFDITEIDGVNTNELYNAVQLYLSSFVSTTGSRLSLSRALNSSATTFSLSNNDTIADNFKGITVHWEHVVTQRQSQSFSWRALPDEKRGFTLRMKKRDKELVLESYLDYIMDKANEIRRNNQERLLYTNSRGGSLDSRGHHPWESVPFKHPSTFETLAMDPERKRAIMDDLREFASGQSFYQRTGRAWKRGYLLYGPPGTGKSSMIAAMANYLGYDIYDLELTEVHSNSELRKLLMKTSSKSIIVIEDIDCSVNLSNRWKAGGAPPSSSSSSSMMMSSMYDIHADLRGGGTGLGDTEGVNATNNRITLSGLLNFTDGLWSCCGSERIFVFTTNHIEKLDPALLRSGRMDMHIFMSYCSFPALKILLKNYLTCDLDDDGGVGDGGLGKELMRELEEVTDKAEMSPADISEVLIKNRRGDRRSTTRELLKILRDRAERNSKYGGGGEVEEEEEEEEKRTLESPKKSVNCQEDMICKKQQQELEEGEEEEKGKFD